MEQKETIIFYKKDNMIYLNYKGEKFEYNEVIIQILKKVLSLPLTIKFNDIPLPKIDTIIRSLSNNMVEVIPKIINKNEYIFKLIKKEKQNKIYGYKITDRKSLLDEREYNPYLLTTINEKKVLLETEKEIAKEEQGDYYLLQDDIAEYERRFLEELKEEIDVDYIYNYNKNMMNKVYSRTLSKKQEH